MATRQVTATRQTRQANQQTLKELGIQATRAVREALHLPSGRNDTTLLRAAIDEVVGAEVGRNTPFAAAIRSRYDELTRLHGTSTKRTARAPLEPLVPQRHTGKDMDPYALPNPQELMWVYGPDKLTRALHNYMLDTLKRTADDIQREHPGTKPTSRASKDAVITYIVAHSPYDASWTP